MSFWRNYYHLTWATKNRLPLIQKDFEAQLYSYIVKKASELDVFVYALDGTEDHTHTVAAIPPKHGVAYIVKHLKGASAHYVNHVIQPHDHFGWQRGYGCLTIGEKQRAIAEDYVRNQKQHHAQQTSIAWLERYTEEDEGPINIGLLSEGESKFVRDESKIYDVLAESPF